MVFEKDFIEQEDIAKNKDEKRGVGEAKIIVSRSHPGPVKANLEVLEKHLGFCLDKHLHFKFHIDALSKKLKFT